MLGTPTLWSQTTVGWQLVWDDEFNGKAGTPPDPSKWNYDIGRGNPPGWGNNELESYTNSTQNAFHDGNGNLVIRAIRDSNGNYTSARLQTGAPGASTHTTDGNWQYGRILARIKLPFLKGTWPAFWMLGENIGSVGWPACGELDILENFGANRTGPGSVSGTAHGPGYSGGQGITKAYTLPYGGKVTDDFHIYAVEWSEDLVQWSVDGVVFHKVTPESLPQGTKWVFNAPFFLLLNLAIGGNAAGNPDANAPFPPQDMLVDYVRVYQRVPAAANAPVITPGGVVNSASFLSTVAPGSLATLYGSSLSGAEAAVSVNGNPALVTYVSATQINFRIPPDTPIGPADVQVTHDGAASNVENITVEAAAPSAFLYDATAGLVWVNGFGCETTECAVHPGQTYWLWGNGFGHPAGAASCQLAIAGQPAEVQYCGSAPGEPIDQLNFVYPAGVPSGAFADATLTIDGAAGHFRVPAPAGQS